MDLLEIIKSIPATDYIEYDLAVGFGDIYTATGLDKDSLSAKLRKLASDGKIKLCVDELVDENLIIAVKVV